jgi:hypothetical protein
MIKQIYFAQRNPATSHDEFLANWGQHAALAGSIPSILERFAGMVQCRRTAEADALPVEQGYDGANILSYRSLSAAAGLPRDPNIGTMLTDERRVFAGYVSEHTLSAEEDVVIAGDTSDYVIVELVTRRTGSDLPEFSAAWTGEFGHRLARDEIFTSKVSRYVHNVVVFPAPQRYPYHGFSEVWIASADDAAIVLERLDQLDTAGGLKEFTVSRRFLFRRHFAWDSRDP